MITVKRLKKLLEEVPDDAKCYAYEGESVGISIYKGKDYFDAIDSKKIWWISASDNEIEDSYTKGFKRSKNESSKYKRK